MMNVINTHSEDVTTKLMNFFSEWNKLRTSVAWFLRLKTVLLELRRKRKEVVAALTVAGSSVQPQNVEKEMRKAQAGVGNQLLSVGDLTRAESAIIRFSQQAIFKEEISMLKGGASGVKKTSDIYRLDPVLKDDLLRVGGRLSQAALPEELKHPVILSKSQHVSNLILRSIHQKLGHAGRNHMLSTLRRRYWITNANSACRRILSDCVVC